MKCHANLPRPIVLTVALASLLLGPAQAATTPLKIIPVPREITRTPDQPLGPAAIVLPGNAPAKYAIATSEINLRLEDLGAKPLPVLQAGSHEERAFSGRRIVLAVTPNARPDDLPAQGEGYAIDSTRPGIVTLTGRDEQGMLWAAVTFRRMLVKGQDAPVSLLGAKIRDWPDFPYRSVGRYHWQKEDERAKGIIDRLFRLKLNVIIVPRTPADSYEELVKKLGGQDAAERYCRQVKDASDYAWARGIACMRLQSSHWGKAPADKDDPMAGRCVQHRRTREYFCWSLDAHNRRRAEGLAKLAALTGVRARFVHAHDGGGYNNPGGWHDRCTSCKERFGNDHAAADTHVFGIWRKAFEQYGPKPNLFSAVQYPYLASVLAKPDDPYYDETVRYWRDLNKRLDPGIAVCVRENRVEDIRKFYEIFDGRPVLVFWMFGDERWGPMFSARIATAKTFLRPGGAPVRMMAPDRDMHLRFPAGAQYMWNANTPGAFDYPGGIRLDRDATEPSVLYAEWVPKFAAEWYGEAVGRDLADMFRGSISLSYALEPGAVATLSGQPNTAARMQQQYEAAKQGFAGLERVWARIEAGERDLIRPDALGDFHRLSEQAGRILAYTSYHLARLRFEEGQRDMKPNRELAAELAAALDRVKADNATAKRMDARIEGKEKSRLTLLCERRVAAQKTLYENPDYDGHIQRLRELWEIAQAGKVTERREPPQNAGSVRWLMQDGDGVQLTAKADTKACLVSYPTQGGSGKAIQLDNLSTIYKDGASFTFPPVNIGDYREKRGRLRFYVNGGGSGGHEFTFWLHGRDPNEAGNEPKTADYGRLSDYVTVDGLEATWQLVDVPLGKVLARGQTEVSGFRLNYAQNGRQGPFWIDSMYVCLPADPVAAQVPVQERSSRPATWAKIEPLRVRPREFVGEAGTESRIELLLRLTGDGKLSDARIALRFLDENGIPFFSHELIRARELRTPRWFEPLSLDLGRECTKATVEMIIRSRELSKTFTTEAVWRR
ncbi:MAG: hypothetical protein JXR37_03525 [Kiritimatiellae bacterium]|nr:hypothetical protein [Kiritimatiellia bacterium]